MNLQNRPAKSAFVSDAAQLQVFCGCLLSTLLRPADRSNDPHDPLEPTRSLQPYRPLLLFQSRANGLTRPSSRRHRRRHLLPAAAAVGIYARPQPPSTSTPGRRRRRHPRPSVVVCPCPPSSYPGCPPSTSTPRRCMRSSSSQTSRCPLGITVDRLSLASHDVSLLVFLSAGERVDAARSKRPMGPGREPPRACSTRL